MGMQMINDSDLGRRVHDGERSKGADETRNGAMDHEKGGDDEGDWREGEPRSGQRRDEVRRKSHSGHSLCFSRCIEFDMFHEIPL